MTDKHELIGLLQQVMAFRLSGDFEAMQEYFAPNISIEFPMHSKLFNWSGKREGIEGVIEALRMIDAEVQVKGNEVLDLVHEGNTLVMRGLRKIVDLQSKKEVDVVVVDFFEWNSDGALVKIIEIFDTECVVRLLSREL